MRKTATGFELLFGPTEEIVVAVMPIVANGDGMSEATADAFELRAHYALL